MTGGALRVLYLLPAEGFGGAERQGVYHLAELPRHGIHVTALVGSAPALVSTLETADVRHERLSQFPRSGFSPGGPVKRARYFARWLASLSRTTNAVVDRLRREPFDLVFANRTFAWLVAASASKRTGVPWVLRAGSRLSSSWFAPGITALDRLVRPAAVFSNCRAVDRMLAPRLHAPRFLLVNAVDTDRYAPGPRGPARARLGLPSAAPIVGLPARPSPEKGFEFLQRVVRRVAAKRADALFVVAGDHGYRSKYEARFRDAGLDATVRFLGHVDAMEDFHRAVDVVVLTSRERSIEASPNSLLEAMAAARPIVATAVGGIPELVRDGVEGHLVPADDAELFANRILELFRAPSRRDAFGRAGRRRAVDQHRVEHVVGGLARTLHFVAAEGVRAPANEGSEPELGGAPSLLPSPSEELSCS